MAKPQKQLKADPVDYDGPFQDEDEFGEFYVVHVYFESKRQANQWMLERLRTLNGDAKKKVGFWRRVFGANNDNE